MRRALALLLLALPGASIAAERVVTLAPHLAELVCAAGGCARLVGVVKHTDYPPEAAAKPQVGDAFAVNLEPLLALKPDLVLSWDGGTSPQVVERLRALGLPVRGVAVRKLDDVARAILDLGGYLGTEDAACAAAAAYRARIAGLRAQYGGSTKLRVLFQIEASPLYTINRDSPISEAIEVCGGINVFAGMRQLSGPVNTEAVIAADPDAVVFAEQDFVADIRSFWKRWPNARAQRLGHLYALQGDYLERQSPRLAEGVAQLCEALEKVRQPNGEAVRPE